MNPFEAVLLLVFAADPLDAGLRIFLTGVFATVALLCVTLRIGKIPAGRYLMLAAVPLTVGLLLMIWTVPL